MVEIDIHVQVAQSKLNIKVPYWRHETHATTSSALHALIEPFALNTGTSVDLMYAARAPVLDMLPQ